LDALAVLPGWAEGSVAVRETLRDADGHACGFVADDRGANCRCVLCAVRAAVCRGVLIVLCCLIGLHRPLLSLAAVAPPSLPRRRRRLAGLALLRYTP
jgi:hypothetical protein